MLTEIMELYKLYQVYKKLEDFKKLSAGLSDEDLAQQCQAIKDLVLGGGFIYIKFAQWIISRLRSEKTRVIQYLVEYFDDIFDNCPYHSLEDTLDIFANAFDESLDDVVNMDSLTVIASGSVGQVYRAELLTPVYKCDECCSLVAESHTGQCPQCFGDLAEIREVAIKIKHPDVDRQVRAKARLFNLLARAQSIKWIKDWFALHVSIKDFTDNLSAQTDFTIEAANNATFRRNFRDTRHLIYFPIVIRSSQDVLITEFVDGKTLGDIQDYAQLKCCLNFGCMIYQMVLVDNFCHGDLHHKNWKIREIQGTNTAANGDYQLVVYDYGICFSSRDINFNRALIKAFKTFDVNILIDNLDGLIDGAYDDRVREFAKQIILKFKEESIDIVHLLNRLNAILATYNCRLTTDSLNTLILLSLIDTTLRTQNLVGGHAVAGIKGDILPSSNVRAKDLDILAYARSRNAYPRLTKFMDAEQRVRRQVSNVVLFGITECNGMVFDAPE